MRGCEVYIQKRKTNSAKRKSYGGVEVGTATSFRH